MNGEGKGATSVLRNVAGRVDIDRSLHQVICLYHSCRDADENRTDMFLLLAWLGLRDM